jgi:hypothetical protein
MHFPNVVAINSPANSTCSSSNDISASTNSRLSSSSSSSSTPTNKNDLLNAAAAAAAYSRLPQLQDFQQQQQQQHQHSQVGYPDYSQFSGQIQNNGYSAAAAAAAYAYLDPLALAASGCYTSYPTQQQQQPGSNSCYQANDGTRRKNATRETTATLKAWLYEHRKNPYPTKGEKIMLAIITKMTLNQVSTWFANARRRLKKENKMSFSPRNK